MFGKKNNANTESTNYSSGGTSTINTLVEGTSLEGTITTQNDLRVDGHVNGTINCDGKLIIGASGHIEGEVTSRTAVVEGTFSGTMLIHEMLDVRETGNINGEVKTGKLTVQDGGILRGNCEMGHEVKALPVTTIT